MAKKSLPPACPQETSPGMTIPTANVEEATAQKTIYIVAPGDILRLEHANAYCKRGKYAILALDTTLCLARIKKKAGQRRVTNHLVYVQITDLCFFKRTKKRLDPLPSIPHGRH